MKSSQLVVGVGLLFLPLLSFSASPTCLAAAGENKVSWPDAVNPVWEMCFVPVNRSSGPRGSGLELRNIHFRGVPIIKRVHSPNLFAEYRNGAGGNCYRDWKDENSVLLAQPAVRNILGTSTVFPATTSCDISNLPTQAFGSCPFGQPGRTTADCAPSGTVAIENLLNNGGMRLTTQYTAGWYKYTARYVFRPNGDIDNELGFGNSDGTFNNTTHWHHNYWRFDFDIDGPSNDSVLINNVVQSTEFSTLRDGRAQYAVWDFGSGFGYRLIPGTNDDTFPANESGRNFHTTDIVATLYKPNELSDRSTWSLSDCTMVQSALANGENIESQDVVLYYRASVRDSTANNWSIGGGLFAPQDSMVCKRVGPMLQLAGTFPIPEGDFSILKDGME